MLALRRAYPAGLSHRTPAPRLPVRRSVACKMSVEQEIIALNQKVLDSIAAGDFKAYEASP